MSEIANQLFLEKKYTEAEQVYREELSKQPEDVHLNCNYAATLLQLGYFEKAEQHFAKALKKDPGNLAALNNRIALLGRLGRHTEAIELGMHLASNAPQDPVIASNLGVALNRLDRYQEAISWFQKAISLKPDYGDAHIGLAGALLSVGSVKECEIQAQQGLELNPDSPLPYILLTMCKLPVTCASVDHSRSIIDAFTSALDMLTHWLKKDRGNLVQLGGVVGDRQPFALAYQTGNLRNALSRYGDLMTEAAGAYWKKRIKASTSKLPRRNKIRLAVLSDQVRRHSVWDIVLKGILANINKNKFELYIYHNSPHIDSETQWAKCSVAKFVQGPKGDSEWIELICEDQPDVIFLPEVGMAPITGKLASLRIAPLQVVSWGHPVTTGFPNIDIYFSGELIEGEKAEDHYSEKLVRLPGTGACTELFDIVSVVPGPEILPLPEDRSELRVLICQRPFKNHPDDDDLIARVISAIAPCKLYMMRDVQYPWATETVINRISEALRCKSLDPENIIIEVPWLNREGFYGMLDEMDIYLDMPAFSGYTTAWQAVHRGMPIVTLEGEFMRQRLAAGLLRKIEQTETIAQTEEEYIEIAARLAQECRDPELRAKRRTAIKAAAPKADHDVSVVRAFEKTLIDELAARGRTFDFVDQPSETTIKTADPAAAPQESTMMNTENNQTAYPWQMLDADLHLHTLTPNYAPTGLLAMLPEHADETRRLKVLDVGCFCGGSGRWIKQKFPGAEVIGIEMLPKAAEVAAPDYDKVIVSIFENVDFEAEGLKHGSVDAIIAADVLEHLYNPWQALQRLKPLLAPGGAIYISLPNIRNLNILSALAKGEWQYAGAGILDVTHIRFFTKKQALEMLAQTGWQATEIRINPDSRLMPAFEGKDLSQIQNIELDNLKLTGLSQEDVLELLALQLFIRAEPK